MASLAGTVTERELEVARIRGLAQARDFAAALAAAEALLLEVPENRDVLYLKAVCQRFLGRLPEALDGLARFEKAHPRFSRVYQEQGHCQLAAGNPGAAIEAYRHAVDLNAALPASWTALELLLRSAGRNDEAATAAAHVKQLAALPAPVVAAAGLLADGELQAAEHVLREFLAANGEHLEALRLLAQIALELDVLADAERLLSRVLELEPGYTRARFDHARVLHKRHRHARALEQVRMLVNADPGNRDYRTLLATVLTSLGRIDAALTVYRELCRERPDSADHQRWMGDALRAVGRHADAAQAYRSAARLRPGCGAALWGLAQVAATSFSEADLARMAAQAETSTNSAEDRCHLSFALGLVLERRGDYAASYRSYARGNALKQSQLRYRPGALERNARLQAALLTREFFAARAGVGCPSSEPIFIIGLPGTAVAWLESALAAHSCIEATPELPQILQRVARLRGRSADPATSGYPGVLATLSPAQLAQFGADYLADTRDYRRGKPHFIDRMPNHFRHLGLIHLMFPNARIIDARSAPLAACFGNFKWLFAAGQEWSYDIGNIVRYYRMYRDLMEHWSTALPGRILRVDLDEAVREPGTHIQRVLGFCGLELESDCLRAGLRGPGDAEWRPFEPWLEPLRQALGPLIEHA